MKKTRTDAKEKEGKRLYTEEEVYDYILNTILVSVYPYRKEEERMRDLNNIPKEFSHLFKVVLPMVKAIKAQRLDFSDKLLYKIFGFHDTDFGRNRHYD